MNLSDIKDVAPAKQPLESGAKSNKPATAEADAARLQAQGAVQVSLSSSESKTLASARILEATLGKNVTINNQKLLDSLPKNPPENKGFDFEKVAENVLGFIGGVINAAKSGGAEDEELVKLFEQAKEGVLKGVEEARKDLAGLLSPEIDDGISKSLDLIQRGIERLEREIFSDDDEEEVTTRVEASREVNISNSESSELRLQTADGDEVTIYFGSTSEFAAEQRASLEVSARENNADEDDEGSSEVQLNISKESQVTISNSEQLQFNVQGELDQDELDAIADLVEKTSSLADEFFNGDVQAAYQQLQTLGFDEQQISNFAIELNQTKQVEIVQTYEQVSLYSGNDSENAEFPRAPVRSVADYAEQLVEVSKEAEKRLQIPESFANLVNDLINKLVDVNTNDLVSAINQFNSFNGRLGVDSLLSNQSQTEEPASS